jgi:hypothetical protein
MFGVAKPQWLVLGFRGNLRRYFNAMLRRRCDAMIDRVTLAANEAYEFQTDGNQYVVVVSLHSGGMRILKGTTTLATLHYLETYSCPANTGSYIVRNVGSGSGDVLLVRYILI